MPADDVPSRDSLAKVHSERPPPVAGRESRSTTANDVTEPEPLWSGRIRVTEEVGRGAMGFVMRGTDTKLRRELALKVSPLPRERLPRGQLARFIEEAQITAQLEHPNVVPVHDIGLDPEGRVYFSMKLVRGQSLADILEKRRQGDPETLSGFGLRRLLDVFLQVCQAVEYAHARGVIHRDLKPANIMVGDFGEVQVMDWGVAKLKGRTEQSTDDAVSIETAEANEQTPRLDSYSSMSDVTSVRAGKKGLATQLGTVLGTPSYMSPEQARGDVVDERTDVYALGIILYEILSGDVPFDDPDPVKIMTAHLTTEPLPPSQLNPATPLALETLALKLLEKEPERRTLTIRQMRTYIQDYIEGFGRDYRRESLWKSALWLSGALALFAFLIWYLTGQSVAAVLALAPPAVFNAIGWFLLVLSVRYPLWTTLVAFKQRRNEPDRFRPPTSEEVFVSGYAAHRTFAAALAPAFQLVFIVELLSVAATEASRGQWTRGDMMRQVVNQLEAGWANALIIILIFLFTYLLLLSSEVRFARRIDRFTSLVDHPGWESVWPVFLIVVLLTSIVVTGSLDWAVRHQQFNVIQFLGERILSEPLNPFEIVKTLVFQGTFLLGLVGGTLLLSFPFAEVLAAFRMPYQPADEASVATRQQYFLRSMAVFHIVRSNWLYGGAMIACLTAITTLSDRTNQPLSQQVLFILGPLLIGFTGYHVTRRYVAAFVSQAPAVRHMLKDQAALAAAEQREANRTQIARAPWQQRLSQLIVPIGCVLAYLVWTGSGVHEDTIRGLILPVSTKGWLLILPYALLLPVLLVRDPAQVWLLSRKRRAGRKRRTAAGTSEPAPDGGTF